VNGGANPGSIGMGQPSTPPRGGGSAASGAGAATGATGQGGAAQGGAAQGGAAGQPGSQGQMGQGQTGQANTGQGQAGTQPSGSAQTRRGALEQQQRAAGVANPAERDAQQLRDLNALSKQLAPNAPPPAPEAGTSPPAR
jgi:hypothetical protein